MTLLHRHQRLHLVAANLPVQVAANAPCGRSLTDRSTAQSADKLRVTIAFVGTKICILGFYASDVTTEGT